MVGEAGLGKTSILAAAAELAAGFEVGRGRGEPMETVVPFGLIAQILASLGADGEALIGERGGAVETSAPYLRLLRWLRARRPGDPPLLLLLDDLHWADADSIGLLAFLARRLAPLPVAVIGALRPWPTGAHEVVADLEAGGFARAVRLHPLDRGSAGRLLERSAGASSEPAMAARAWELCRGNPFLIEQLGGLLARGEGIPEPDGEGDGHGHLLLRKFAGLDAPGMRCARCAAVIGVRFRVDLALAAAALDPEQERRALEALTASGLVVEDEGGWMRFAHPLFAQSLYEEIVPALRRRLHARVFELLAAGGYEEEAAEHAILADLAGDRRAAEVLERVGRAALAAGAAAGAARYLEAAVRFRGDRCPPELLLLHARSLVGVARVADAGAVCGRLLAGTGLDWRIRVEALRALGQANYLTGAGGLGDEQLREAVEVAVANDPTAAVRPLLDRSSIAWMARGPAAALPLAARARELAAGEPGLRETAEARWGHLAIECGEPWPTAAVEPIDRRLRAGTTAELLDPAELIWPTAAIYGFAHVAKCAERYEDSLRALCLAREALEEAGAANGIATVTNFIGNLLVWWGRPAAALVEADRAEEFSELTPMALPIASLIRSAALLWLGRLAESEEHRQIALRRAPDPDLWLIGLWSRLSRAIGLLWQGDERASVVFLEIERLVDAAGIREPSNQPWAGFAVQAHLAVGRRGDAARVGRRLEDVASRHPSRWPKATAALSAARLLDDEGDVAAATRSFEAAIELLREVDLPLARAEALLAYGAFTRRRVGPVDARAPLHEALDLAEAAGAAHFTAAAHAELRLAGGRRSRTRGDRDRLTAAELRVAREAARGRTNREIARRLNLSPNTVRTHLKRIYPKLGVNSRQELADADLGDAAGNPH